MVDENAGESVPDRPVDEHRRDRRVDPTRERADDGRVAYLLPNAGDGVFDEGTGRPGGAATRDLEQEVGEDLVSPVRVGDLRVELHGKDRPVRGTERSHGERVGRR